MDADAQTGVDETYSSPTGFVNGLRQRLGLLRIKPHAVILPLQ